MPNNHLTLSIQQDAAQCVKCGLCLPHCPTYLATAHEGESPRGRIALMAGIANQKIPSTPALLQHLDHCLTCRACETVCPAQVPYGNLLDNSRSLLRQQGHRSLPKSISKVIRSPKLLNAAAKLLRLYQTLGLRFLLRSSHLLKLFPWLKRADALLPDLSANQTWATYYPPLGEKKGDVALFLGCITPLIEVNTVKAAIQLLTSGGYGIHLPARHGCCGALHRHAGETSIANQLQAANLSAFAKLEVTAILSLASGCGAVLKEYNLHSVDPMAQAFSAKVQDIHSFLVAMEWPWQLQPLAETIAVHIPCTLRHVLHQEAALVTLLKLIPQITLQVLTTPGCCGGAGINMLQEASMADALLNTLLNPLKQAGITRLVTANTGCRLHIAKGLREGNPAILLQHPLELFANQICR
jgi:glycolate oxidase iron-sulfur subunit